MDRRSPSGTSPPNQLFDNLNNLCRAIVAITLRRDEPLRRLRRRLRTTAQFTSRPTPRGSPQPPQRNPRQMPLYQAKRVRKNGLHLRNLRNVHSAHPFGTKRQRGRPRRFSASIHQPKTPLRPSVSARALHVVNRVSRKPPARLRVTNRYPGVGSTDSRNDFVYPRP